MIRHMVAIVVMLICGLAIALPASAQTRSIDHGGTYFGNITVDRDQVVDGDVTVIGGDATIFGRINGSVTMVGGSIDQRPGSTITGDTNVVGSDVAQNLAPWLPMQNGDPFAHQYRKLGGLAFNIVAILLFLIFPARVRVAISRLEHHAGLAAATGLLGWIAVFPLAFLLLCTILLIPLIPVEFVVLAAGVFLGKAALGLLVGRRFYEMVAQRSTPTPLVALIIGLLLISAAEMLPMIGLLAKALVWIIGLGAALLSCVGEDRFSGPIAAGPRAPIGGPPMVIR